MSATLLRAAPVTHRRICPAEWVNDVHSGLNPTKVRKIVVPSSEKEIANAVNDASVEERPICVSGSRHSMGGQQFARDETLLDLRGLRRVLHLDRHAGIIEVESGIQWPDLMSACLRLQPDTARPWTIRQKQTGADQFTLGGSLSSNIHGRGLAMKPLIDDVESFTLIDSRGESICCSRHQNRDLFQLAIGGYGLFGVISRVRLRLQRRRKLRRLVKVVEAEAVTTAFAERIREGCLYGDFQFSIDEVSPHFLRRGVFSCYEPVDDDTPISVHRQLSSDDWLNLLHLAHTDRAEGFRRYTAHYLASHGQTYWSDTHQLSPYLPDYSQRLRGGRGADANGQRQRSSLVISELYVPRPQLASFLRESAQILRAARVPVIYGTVRLIERDDESALPWAKEPYACIIFNLLTPHTARGQAVTKGAFLELIDLATAMGGSFYLTYHRYAHRARVERCYPGFTHFLRAKDRHDAQSVFQSDWWRSYRYPAASMTP